MMVGVIRFFRGYVDFSAEGKFPERFLNITSRNGVSLWNAQPVKNGKPCFAVIFVFTFDFLAVRLIFR